MGLIYYNNNPYLHNVEKFSLKPLCQFSLDSEYTIRSGALSNRLAIFKFISHI